MKMRNVALAKYIYIKKNKFDLNFFISSNVNVLNGFSYNPDSE